jgi:3'-phosphoadenosine 5'-phosphosulfate (PAPS) 3'-phosphatase
MFTIEIVQQHQQIQRVNDTNSKNEAQNSAVLHQSEQTQHILQRMKKTKNNIHGDCGAFFLLCLSVAKIKQEISFIQ